jgi:hypothetical protein
VYDQDNNIVKSVLRGHLWDKEILALPYRGPFKRGSIHMKFSMTGNQWYVLQRFIDRHLN